jgi:ADP-heptose:LPS heptosyltransferase
MLTPLGAVPGVSFVGLQKGPAASEARQPPRGMRLLDLSGEIGDLEDTAAIVANLDLTIAVDTSVAHLAGALGAPVWLMNVFDSDWRWMPGRSDSPWYPAMRVFRQPAPGDWAAVVREVAAALEALAARRGLPAGTAR